jgi:hypothetical protein
MNNYGIEEGDVVLVRYANKDDPRSSSRNEQIQITGIDKSGRGYFGVIQTDS